MMIGFRALRSFSFGYVGFILPLYLHFAGMSYVLIGLYALVATVASAMLSLMSGFFGDFYGRRRMLLILSLMFPLMMSILIFERSLTALFFTSLLGVSFTGGIGGGSGGGPIAPLQTSLLADMTTDDERTGVFSRIMSMAVISALAGSAFSGLVSLFFAGRHYYLFLFAVGLITSVISFLFVLLMRFEDRVPESGSPIAPRRSSHGISRIAISGLFGSLGLGMITPFIPLWFSDIMHASNGEISVIYFLSYLCTAIAVFLAPAVENSIGRIRGISLFRGLSSVLLVAIPFSGSLMAAAAIYIIRTGMYSMTIPLRQSFSMQIFDPSERARGAGITGIARRIPFGISATLSGVLFAIGISAVAFASAGAISVLDPILYFYFFKDSSS